MKGKQILIPSPYFLTQVEFFDQSNIYDLREIGVKDIVLIEKVVSHLKNTVIKINFTKYSRQLYERLHKEGHDIGKIEKFFFK